MGSFDLAINGIGTLKKHGYSVSIQSVLSKITAPQLEKFFALADFLKVDFINFVRLVAKSKEQKALLLSSEELKISYQNIILNSIKYQVSSPFKNPLFQLFHPKLGGSGGYGDGLVIDYKGNVKLSSRLDITIGSALYGNLEEIYFHDPILKKVRSNDIYGCKGCEYIKKCGGDRNAAYVFSGNYLGVDPGCWKPTQKEQGNDEVKETGT